LHTGAIAVVLLGFLAVALHQIWLVGDFRVDDAYITFSYSKNLATGHGPVYSHDLTVEGYSNFLWMVATALAMAITRVTDPYWIARCLGLAAVLLTLVVVYRAVWRSAGTWPALLATGFILCCTDLFRAGISGMETAAYVAAVITGWYVYFREPWPHWKWASLALLPAALMRIDGFVPVLAVVGFEFLYSLYQQRFTYRRFFRWVAPVAVGWSLYFAWRWHYYGLPLPTTYYAKSMATAHDPQRGLHIFQYFLDDYRVVVLSPFLVAALLWGPRAKTLAFALAIACQVAYTIHVGGDWMPFHRFVLPAIPMVAILVGWGSERIWRRTHAFHAILRWPVRLCALACIGYVAMRMHAASVDGPGERAKLVSAVQTTTHTRNNLLRNVDLLRHVIRRPGERLVTDYAGVFALHTEAEIIDMWGLCNADIALRGNAEGINPEYGKACADCYAQLQPDYFHVIVPIVRSTNSFSNIQQVIDAVFQGRAIDKVINLQRNYAVGRVVESETGRTLWFLERKRSGILRRRRVVAEGTYVEYPFE
jgi:arabinofuranosyltransferase